MLSRGPPSAHTLLPCPRKAVTVRLWDERPGGCRRALGSAVSRGGHECTPGTHVTCRRKGPASGRSHSTGWAAEAATEPQAGLWGLQRARGGVRRARGRGVDPGTPLGENRWGAPPARLPDAGQQAQAAVFPAPSPLPRRPPPKIPAPGSAPRPIGPALAGARILFVPQPFQAPDGRQRRFGRKARAPEASGMVWDRVGWREGAWPGRRRVGSGPSELRPAAAPRGPRSAVRPLGRGLAVWSPPATARF